MKYCIEIALVIYFHTIHDSICYTVSKNLHVLVSLTIPRLPYCAIFRRALTTQFEYLKVQVSKVHKKADTANCKRLHNRR